MQLTLSMRDIETILHRHLTEKVLKGQDIKFDWKSEDGTDERNIVEIDLDNVWIELDLGEVYTDKVEYR